MFNVIAAIAEVSEISAHETIFRACWTHAAGGGGASGLRVFENTAARGIHHGGPAKADTRRAGSAGGTRATLQDGGTGRRAPRSGGAVVRLAKGSRGKSEGRRGEGRGRGGQGQGSGQEARGGGSRSRRKSGQETARLVHRPAHPESSGRKTGKR